MIDTNGLNAALTALIRPIVLEIVEREFSALEHLRSRVAEAHQALCVHRNLLANLETAIETLGKRVTENMLEADRQLDIHRKEIDTAFRGVGMRIDYGETRLNEARGAIRELQGKAADLATTNNDIIGEIDDLKNNLKTPAVLTDTSDTSDVNSAIDKRLIEVLTRTHIGTYHPQQALLEFVQTSINESTEDLVPRHALDAYVDAKLDDMLEGERLVDVVKDVIDETVESKEERIRRVVRDVLNHEVVIQVLS